MRVALARRGAVLGGLEAREGVQHAGDGGGAARRKGGASAWADQRGRGACALDGMAGVPCDKVVQWAAECVTRASEWKEGVREGSRGLMASGRAKGGHAVRRVRVASFPPLRPSPLSLPLATFPPRCMHPHSPTRLTSTHPQSTPTTRPRVPLAPTVPSSSSSNPHASFNPPPLKPVHLATPTFHRFRTLVKPVQPSRQAHTSLRASPAVRARTDSPPPSGPPTASPASLSPRSSQQGHAKPRPSDPLDAGLGADAHDGLRRRVVGSTLLRSAAVQTSLPRSSAKPTECARTEPAPKAAAASTNTTTSPSIRFAPPPPEDAPRPALAPLSPSRASPAAPTARQASLKPRNPPAPFPHLTTAHLAPFQRHLGARREVYVELLASGELLLDPRRRARSADREGKEEGREVFLFSADGEEVRFSLWGSRPSPRSAVTAHSPSLPPSLSPRPVRPRCRSFTHPQPQAAPPPSSSSTQPQPTPAPPSPAPPRRPVSPDPTHRAVTPKPTAPPRGSSPLSRPACPSCVSHLVSRACLPSPDALTTG